MSSQLSSSFVARLLEEVPELNSAYEKHLNDNDQLLPHVLMGDVSREIIKASQDPSKLPWIKHVLRFFESELQTNDHDAQNLVRASFCENLMGETLATHVLVPLMGPTLRSAMGELNK